MTDNTALEKKLWAAADKLRNNMDAAVYKHVVLGLIFLKYISDAFESQYQKLVETQVQTQADPNDRDEYTADNVFFVPEKARWQYLQARAKLPEIGLDIDAAMDIIEAENPPLKGVLPKDYARPDLDKRKLGEIVDLIGTIQLHDKNTKARDLLGHVFEYFLGEFANAEGKKGGQFYTPACIVELLVEMLQPQSESRVYDGCCGSGGMFVQSERFIAMHENRIGKISIYGQESNPTTYRLAKMNLAIRGIEAQIALGDTLANDKFPNLKFDFVFTNPPFNVSDYQINKAETHKWQFGIPHAGNANYAWVQHYISKLSPNGAAGIVLANGSMSGDSSGEGDIRRLIIEADLVDCMVALPSQLFFNTGIPACLWILHRNKAHSTQLRARKGEILFIDARELGTMISRSQRKLTTEDISNYIAGTYHRWRERSPATPYADIAGFCKSANLEQVRANNYVLTPGRYVEFKERIDDGASFADKMQDLTATLAQQMQKSQTLDKDIRENLQKIGFPLDF